jgi:hypothetical protein
MFHSSKGHSKTSRTSKESQETSRSKSKSKSKDKNRKLKMEDLNLSDPRSSTNSGSKGNRKPTPGILINAKSGRKLTK